MLQKMAMHAYFENSTQAKGFSVYTNSKVLLFSFEILHHGKKMPPVCGSANEM